MCFDVASFHRASVVTSFRHVEAILLKDVSREIFSGASVEFIHHDIVLAWVFHAVLEKHEVGTFMEIGCAYTKIDLWKPKTNCFREWAIFCI